MWNKNDFIGRKPATIKYFAKKEITSESISEYCSLAGLPITVVCEFIIEAYPEHTEMCQKKIAELNEFYGIKE